MRKAVCFALALTLAVTLSAAAEQIQGTIKTIDSGDRTMVLVDGTQLWSADGHLAGLEPGDQVLAVYETKGDKKMVQYIAFPSAGPDGQVIPHFGVQSGD